MVGNGHGADEGDGRNAVAATRLPVFRPRRWHESPTTRGVTLLSFGLVALIGEHASGLSGPASGASTPSLLQIAALVAYPLLACGMLTLAAGRSMSWDLDSVLEAMLVPALLVFVTWAAFIRPGQAWSPTVLAFALGRPALDLVVALLALCHLSAGERRLAATTWQCLAAGMTCLLVVDIASSAAALGQPGSPVSVVLGLLLAGWTLIAAGCVTAGRERDLEVWPRAQFNAVRLSVVMAAVLAGPVLFVVERGRALQLHGGQLALGAVILSGLAVAYLVRHVEEGTRLGHLALHDDLTGLPNRVLFADRVTTALVQGERSGQRAAVLFLDLDRFKTINDSLGHTAGNELLQLVSRRLRGAVREEDTVARLGGDEFTILMPHLDGERDIAVPTERVLAAFTEPFHVANRELFVSPSIGVAVAPADGTDVEVLLTNADAAMYRAKSSGRNTFSFYTPDLNAQAHKRLARESNLHTALERGELVLHYQPKVDLTTGMLVGMEALARWNHRDEGLILPDEFIPLAEETGLIVALGEWALETACAQTREWRADGLDLKVAVNLSARQFEHQQVADVVARVLRNTGLEPTALELELTESVALADPAATMSTLQQFRSLGVSCSIDDFGTGYNGLSYLSRLPIDTLKIDKSFIDQIARGEDEGRIVAAIIALAHGLRMTVIAEGVETDEQLDFLHASGCDELQGFLFSRPLPAEEFRELLNHPVPLSFARMPPRRRAGRTPLAVVRDPVGAGTPRAARRGG